MKVRQVLAGALIFALCGAPEVIGAQQSAPSGAPARPSAAQTQPPAVQTQSSPQQPETPGAVNGVTVDPSRGPLQPAPSASPPQAAEPTAKTNETQAQQQNAQPQTQSLPQNPEPQAPGEPVGAAAAQPARTAGGAASKPAGTAIAPAKQRQVRSRLIRVGAIAAAGAAVGTVYALSRKTPSTPPGTQTLGAH